MLCWINCHKVKEEEQIHPIFSYSFFFNSFHVILLFLSLTSLCKFIPYFLILSFFIPYLVILSLTSLCTYIHLQVYLFKKYIFQPHSLDPSDKTRICLFLLNLIQFPDENLKSTCQRLIPSVPRPLLACWATRLIGIQEKGIAGLMDLFQAGIQSLQL